MLYCYGALVCNDPVTEGLVEYGCFDLRLELTNVSLCTVILTIFFLQITPSSDIKT